MRKAVLHALAFSFFALTLSAQNMPQKSAACTITQTVGLTDVTVAYSRPDVDGRTIFGDLVPYNELWRTAANKATMVTFSDDVTVEGKSIPAGNYSLFTIPGKSKWTIIFNKETELWGTGGYKKEDDQARFEVDAQKIADNYETFTIDFSDIETESANMRISWENTQVSFSIKVNAQEQAWANINKGIADYERDWRVYVRAASFAVESGENLDKAIEWTNKALEVEEYWWTYMVQGQVYAAKKDYKNAIKSTKKSLALGNKMKEWGYKSRVEAQLKEYESKS